MSNPAGQCEWIWHNGDFIPWADANVHVTTHALHYGSSVFEGVRAYSTPNGPAVFRLREHTRRLANSCKIARIELPWTLEQLDAAILDVVRRNGFEACYVRPLVMRGAGPLGVEGRRSPTDSFIFAWEWGRYLGPEAIEKGVDVQISTWRRYAPDTAASMAKIGGQYVNSQFISMEAHDGGFNDGLALDYNGNVSEGAGENLFVVYDNVVYTPGAGSSILLGITRDAIIKLLVAKGYEIRREPIPRDMLYIADEVFFTGTAAEVTPVRSIDRIQIGAGSRGPVTTEIQEEFFGITSGRLPDRYGWLSPVRQTEPGD